MINLVFENGKIYVSESYKVFYDNICKEHELDKEAKQFLIDYVFYYYDEKSPYHKTHTNSRQSEIKKYQYKGDNKFDSLYRKIEKCLSKIEEITMSQEERIYYGLITRIDKVFNEFVNAKIDLGSLEDEPKRVKAMNDLLAMKEKQKANLQKSDSVNDKLRAGKTESFIEKRNKSK